MKIKVLFFASIREIFDCNEKIVDITHNANLTPDLLLENFSSTEKGPWLILLNKKKLVRVAINQTIAEWQSPLFDGDELAFLPPITGG
ncbi:MAG: MoaD/ThiS family protein [Methylophilaceae bacterium]|nr:MoaD/ThiS family protein [Methylophilaceae bacterium]